MCATLDDRGSTLMEFALAMPLFLLMLLGGAELGSLLLATQKVQRLASTMADLVAQSDGMTARELDKLLAAGVYIASPYDLPAHGRVIVSGVTLGSDGTAQVAWQRKNNGSLEAASLLGGSGATAALPNFLPLRSGETIVVAEAFYDYLPFLAPRIIGRHLLYEQAFFRPRLGSLQDLGE